MNVIKLFHIETSFEIFEYEVVVNGERQGTKKSYTEARSLADFHIDKFLSEGKKVDYHEVKRLAGNLGCRYFF